MMKRVQIAGFALVAVFALIMMLASSAFAEVTLLAEWLENGSAIVSAVGTKTSGEILIEDDKVPLVGKVAITCSGVLVGNVGSNGKGEVTEVLNLAEEKIGTNLSGTALLCKTETECESSATDIEVWPVTLPWSTEVFLMENGEYLDLIKGSGYEVKCLIAGITVEDKCEASDTDLHVENGSKGVETPADTIAEPLATCSEGGTESGVDETVTVAEPKLTSGEELTVSSEEC